MEISDRRTKWNDFMDGVIDKSRRGRYLEAIRTVSCIESERLRQGVLSSRRLYLSVREHSSDSLSPTYRLV